MIRRLHILIILSLIASVCAAASPQKRRRTSTSGAITPRIETTEVGKVKIYQKKRGKTSVDIRIPIAYPEFGILAEQYVGRDFELDDDGVPSIPQSIKMFLRNATEEGSGISVSPFANSDQYLQLRLSRFENGGNSGHLENEFKIIDRQTKKPLFIYDIIESESDWHFKSEQLLDAINFVIKSLRNQYEGLETLKDTDDFNYYSMNFWLDSDGICFWFGRCGIAPCAYGSLVIKVPYENLKSIIKPEVYKKLINQTNFKHLPLVKFAECWDDEVFTPLNQ